MLLDIRERVRGSKPLKYTLITIIAIPFALVGIGSYFSGGTAQSVATVNGEEIDQQALDRAYNQQRQQLAQLFGGEIPEGFANESLLRQQALEQLISQRVVRSAVIDEKLSVSDGTLGREIRELQVFQVDGRFDDETYRQQLRANGLSVAQFEQQFREDTAIGQFQRGVTDTSFVLPSEQRRLDALQGQQRRAGWLVYSLAAAREGIEISDDEAQGWFEDNSEQFRFPERSKLAYIELDAAALAEEIEVTDDEAQAWYDDNRRSYMRPELRSASHILLELDDPDDEAEVADKTATLEELKGRLDAGDSFEALAREFSTDIGSADAGGSLGDIARDVMDSAFEEALYALPEEGALSEPVQSEFGLHLIRLDGIQPESGQPFDEVRDEIVQTLKRNAADTEFFELREQLAEQSFDAPESLEAAADATGLPIVESDWIDRDTEGQPLLTQPAVLDAAGSEDVLVDGNNSDVIEVGDRHVIVLRVLEHEDERPQTFEDVRDTVVARLRDERAGEQLDERVAADLTELAQEGDITRLTGDDDVVSATVDQTLERNATEPGGSVVGDIFALSKPGEEGAGDGAYPTGSGTLPNGDRIAYRLLEVLTPEASADSATEETPPAAGPGADALGGVEFQAMVDSLREQADVSIAE